TTFDLSVKAAISDGLVTWIMNYGENIEVIKPDIIRDMVKARAEKIAEIYR
ncbi:MAG: WYL domain-containing protein, partial [Clostridia bacterium]|nr:WYL domain-containing protein [Clostridia bacterium]